MRRFPPGRSRTRYFRWCCLRCCRSSASWPSSACRSRSIRILAPRSSGQISASRAPRPAETRDADPAEGRGRGRQHRQCQEHPLRGHRGLGQDDHRVPDRHAGRSGHHRCARCGGAECARTCRRASRSRRCIASTSMAGPIVYYAISTTGMSEEQLSWFVDDTHHQAAAGRSRRRAGHALRRRARARSAWTWIRRAWSPTASRPGK